MDARKNETPRAGGVPEILPLQRQAESRRHYGGTPASASSRVSRGGFRRELLPDPIGYYQSVGLRLVGRGPWRTTRCGFHGGSDSLRIQVETGGWVCMTCGESGGDVLAFEMALRGIGFVEAAKALGCWDGHAAPGPARPRAFSAADALAVLGADLHLLAVVLADARRGILPSAGDWSAFLAAAARVILISGGRT